MLNTPAGYEIGRPLPREIPYLPGIEIAAATIFPREDVAPELRAEGLPLPFFRKASSEDRLWVARAVEGRVPWNGPFYAKVGFREIPDDDLGPELLAMIREEAEHGLDPAKRVAMSLDLRAA